MNDHSITGPASARLTILHLAPLQWGRIGGLNAAILALIEEQNLREDVQAALVLTGKAQELPSDSPFPVFDRRQLFRTPRGTGLRPPFDRPHLAVFHSTYIPSHAAIARRLRKAGIPYILCPHGGMTRHIQSHHKWKKRLGNLLFFNRLVAHAEAVQHLSSGEAAVSRGWNRPVFVVGNGIYAPDDTHLARPGKATGLRLVFLGRLDIEIKGLDLLLDACVLVRTELRQRQARLELYGPKQKGSSHALAQRIAQLGLGDIVFLKPPIRGPEKAAVLQQADLLVLTSRTEGHPMAVLEALSYGVPCLLTPGTNMAEEVAAAGAGWQVAPTAEAIAGGLRQFLAADQKTLETLGANARRLALEKYTWEQVAKRTVEAYRKYAA